MSVKYVSVYKHMLINILIAGDIVCAYWRNVSCYELGCNDECRSIDWEYKYEFYKITIDI